MSEETVRTDVVQHRLGECPACRCGLWAEVTIETETRSARLDDDGRPSATTSSRATGMRVEHRCGRAALAACGADHPGGCSVPDATGVCELSDEPTSEGR